MLIPWQENLGFTLLAVVVAFFIGYAYEGLGRRRDLRLHPAPGLLVSVGGHKLHLLCKGLAAPTVVIEQGAGELSRYWWQLQDQVAEFARVCTYDRAGYGWSGAERQGRTIEDRAEELHRLLAGANFPAPYIFVAHSYGGLIVRSYNAAHPEKVAGLVLIDCPEESSIFQQDVLDFYAKVRVVNGVAVYVARFGVLRLMRNWFPLDRYGFWLTRPTEYLAVCDDLASLERVPEAKRNSKPAGSLGSLPMVVITHGKPFPGPFAVLEKNWAEGQKRLAALSTESVLIVAEKSNHMVQHEEPELVLSAIRRVHDAVRSRVRLN